MGQFKGYTCDGCQAVIDKGKRSRRVVKIDGPIISGEYAEDLCPDCTTVPEGVTLKPLRRRKVATAA